MGSKICIPYIYTADLGSAILEAPAAFEAGMDSSLVLPVVVGVIVSAVSGLFAIKGMIKIVSNKKLTYFSFYTWALGIAMVIYAVLS